MKTQLSLLLVFATILLVSSCTDKADKRESTEDYIIFGDFYGFCPENCNNYYKIEGGVLYKDQLHQYPSQNMSFDFATYTNAYNQSILDLTSELPTGIYNESDYIGNPDILDQGGYYIEVRNNGNTTHWKIDKIESSVPIYLHTVCDSMEHYLSVLN